MMRGKIALVSTLLVGLGACQHIGPSGAESQALEPEGRVLVHGGLRGPSASFGADRVIGPTINMTRGADGEWVGWLRGVALNLAVADGQISSSTLTMNVQELSDGIEIRGLWNAEPPGLGDQISIRVTRKELYVREPFVNPPVYLDGIGEGSYGTGRFGNSVELIGTAAQLHPPQPQFALALLAAF